MRTTLSLFATPMLCLLASAACSGTDGGGQPSTEDPAQSQQAMMLPCIQLSSAPLISAAYPVVQSGASWVAGTPEVGDQQVIEVDWSTPTLPVNPFLIRVALPGYNFDTTVGNAANPITAEVTQKLLVPLTVPGDSTRPLPLDGPIPYSVSVDPTHVSGLPGPSCVKSGTYSPTGPAAAIEEYMTQKRIAAIAVDASITPPASGATGTLYMGYPLSTNHQTVLSTLINSWWVGKGGGGRVRPTVLASGAFSSFTEWSLPPFYAQNVSPWLAQATSLHAEIQVEVNLSRVRVNKALLDQVTWAQLQAGILNEPDLPNFVVADAVNNPNDPAITAFVNNTLGANYKLNWGPYEAARKLFVAVANAITYKGGTPGNPTPSTAVAALAAGTGDCGDYGMLLVTVLRAVGIPARIMYGQWPTNGGTHVITELWLPGATWIPADATSSSVLFPKSGYPYFFGNTPDLDIWVGFGFGNNYQGDGLSLTWVEGPGLGNSNVAVNTWNVTQTNDPAP